MTQFPPIFVQVMQLQSYVIQHQRLVVGVVAGLLLLAFLMPFLRRSRRDRATYGSAKWATRRQMTKAGIRARHGVILGQDGRRLLRHDGPEHILLTGPTRSGKGVSTIIPTLLSWKESAVILDPKDGENYDVTSTWRRTIGYVCAFTPCRAPTHRFNVLDTIRLGTVYEVKDAMMIARSWTAPEHLERVDDTARHFWDLATLFLTAAILHVCYVGKAKTPAALWEFLTQEHSKLSEVLKTMVQTPHIHGAAHPVIVQRVRAIQNITGDKELSGVWTTSIRPLSLYSDPLVAASTSHSDFPLEALQYGSRPMSLYLVAPSPMTLDYLHPIYRVMMDVIGTRLTEHKVRTWKHRLLNCYDELPAHGYCHAVEKGIAVHAGYGQKYLLVTQDLGQLEKVYGHHSAIWGNCHVKVWHTPDNDLTAKRLAENILGRETIQSQSTSRSGRFGERHSVSQHPTGRQLLTTDEVMGLPADTEIIQIGGTKALVEKVNYRTDTRFLTRIPRSMGGYLV